MKAKYMALMFELMCEKLERLQEENFSLGMENALLKDENEELKSLLKEVSSDQKQS